MTPGENKPTVHTQLYRIKDFDLREKLTPEEIQIRGAFRPMPNAMGFSLYYRELKNYKRNSHFSIIENTLLKKASGTWTEWLQDLRDRRDMKNYLYYQFKRV